MGFLFFFKVWRRRFNHQPCLLFTGNPFQNKDASVAAATAFLEGQLPGLTRPYAIAITAYALALANSNQAQEAIGMLKGKATYIEGKNYTL